MWPLLPACQHVGCGVCACVRVRMWGHDLELHFVVHMNQFLKGIRLSHVDIDFET